MRRDRSTPQAQDASQKYETSRRQLHQRDAELAALYNTLPIGLSLLDTDLRYLRINDELAAINGFSAADHIGKRQEDLIPDIDLRTKDIQMEVLRTGVAKLGIEISGETPKQPGVLRHWIVDYYPVGDDDIFAIGCSVREVTAQKTMEAVATRAAAEAIEAQTRMTRLFDQAPALISIFEGPEHRYIYSNPMHDAAVGNRQLIGKPVRAALPELAGQGIIERFDEVYRTGETHLNEELPAVLSQDASGAMVRRYYRQIVQPWFKPDGDVAGVMTFNYDITDLVEAREQVLRSQQRLQTVQDSLTSFVGLLHIDGTLLEANATALAAANLKRTDVIGKKFWDCWWWAYDTAVQDRLRAAIAQARSGHIVRYETEIRIAQDLRVLIDFQLVPSFDAQGRVSEIIPSGVDITQWRAAENRKDILLAELQHRVKNTLATVQSVVNFTARTSVDMAQLVSGLESRFTAISRTHDGLTRQDWRGQSLKDIVTDELEPYGGGDTPRLVYSGPDLWFEPTAALSLALAIHELATNAAKYGALSTPTGYVNFHVDKTGPQTTLEWVETGGPHVHVPDTSGFGSFLIERVLSQDLEADVDLEFAPTGVTCRVVISGDTVDGVIVDRPA